MSSVMSDFVLWIFQQLPAFLLAEPVCYFTGCVLCVSVLELIHRLFTLTR